MSRLSRIAAVVALGAITAGLAACGGGKETPKLAPAGAPKAATADAAATPAALRPLTVVGTEYAFALDGQAVPGIQTITFRNAGKEYHELQLVSLDRGYTLADAQKILSTPGAAIPDWVKFNGGAWAIPGGTQSTMTAKLAAGSYVLLCLLEDPDRPWSQPSWRAGDGSNRAPHFAKGMVAVMEVKGTEAKDTAPTATLAIEASDNAFKAPAEVPAGKTTISLKNNGKEAHFAGLVRAPDGVSYEAFTRALLTPTPAAAAATPPAAASPRPAATGTAAVTAAAAVASGVSGGVGALSAGGQAWSTTDLRAGTYAIICLIPDAKGVPHAALGMISKLTVK